ncbi:UNVERIFIED_CONTAM: hypothetical protein GTU68_052043 [Idotea baltica]|nr:hypothetical protein [Idotea baltica]
MLIPDYALHLLAFLIGAIPVGVLLTKARGIDVRSVGSGNIGATNVARTAGAKLGIITLLADVLKGSLGTSLGDIFAHSPGDLNLSGSLGLAVVLGHCFSPFLKFKGGKGVATGLGTFLYISPLAGIGTLVVFGVVFYLSKFVSLSSIIAAASLPFLILLIHKAPDSMLLLYATLIPLVLILRHLTNIKRLLRGEEAKFKLKKS